MGWIVNYVQDTSFVAFLKSGGQSGGESGVNWDAAVVAALGLLLFGLAYSALIHLLNRHGLNDGYVWLEVVVGVAVTLLAASFVVGWGMVAVLFLLFAASGLFPALGDIYRYARARQAESRRSE